MGKKCSQKHFLNQRGKADQDEVGVAAKGFMLYCCGGYPVSACLPHNPQEEKKERTDVLSTFSEPFLDAAVEALI